MSNSIHNIDFDINKEMLIEESKVCDYVPINRVTLRRVKMGSYAETKGKKFSDFLNEEDKDWWLKQDTWQSSMNADAEMLFKMPETTRILSYFKSKLQTENIEANFFTQKQGTSVKMHVDVGTPCAINFIIKGEETPIVFEEEGTFFYKTALLNVSKKHMVPEQETTDRMLFKLRILDLNFDEAKERLC